MIETMEMLLHACHCDQVVSALDMISLELQNKDCHLTGMIRLEEGFPFASTYTPPKTNMDTNNDGLEKVDFFKSMTLFGIYVRFLGCNQIQQGLWLFVHCSLLQL